MKLTDNFDTDQFTVSATARNRGIKNELPDDLLANAKYTAEMMERVRAILKDNPVIVSSCYRNPALNAAVGGSATSAHRFALAVDFTCAKFGSPRDICYALTAAGMPFDQLILEFDSWVHIGFSNSRMRQQVLTAVKRNGKTVYLAGLV